mmetsp:Transcript_46719/g.144671  ORF Transcript_46719/g.144671 Transcript_46719/m.144671 type:complete len:346 (-) Transcript_46719:8-1045(-)
MPSSLAPPFHPVASSPPSPRKASQACAPSTHSPQVYRSLRCCVLLQREETSQVVPLEWMWDVELPRMNEAAPCQQHWSCCRRLRNQCQQSSHQGCCRTHLQHAHHDYQACRRGVLRWRPAAPMIAHHWLHEWQRFPTAVLPGTAWGALAPSVRRPRGEIGAGRRRAAGGSPHGCCGARAERCLWQAPLRPRLWRSGQVSLAREALALARAPKALAARPSRVAALGASLSVAPAVQQAALLPRKPGGKRLCCGGPGPPGRGRGRSLTTAARRLPQRTAPTTAGSLSGPTPQGRNSTRLPEHLRLTCSVLPRPASTRAAAAMPRRRVASAANGAASREDPQRLHEPR